MKKLLTVAAVFASSLLFTGVAFASGATNCQPIYGGGQTCAQTGQVTINKTVQDPKTLKYVDNLGINDVKYGPDQTINFQITISNVSDTTVNNIHVTDTLPKYITFIAGPGSFDKGANTLSFNIASLDAKQSQTFTIQGKVFSYNAITDLGISCVVNQSEETANGQTSADNAQFCIEKPAVTPTPGVPTMTKGGLPVYPAQPGTTTPPTGPEALGLLALLPAGGLGAFLRRKNK